MSTTRWSLMIMAVSLLATAATDATEAAAVQDPAPAVRVFAHDDLVVACLSGASAHGGAECPEGLATTVGLIPPADGDLVLPVCTATVVSQAQVLPEDPCGENRLVQGCTNSAVPLGRKAQELPLDHATYRKLVGEAVGLPEVQLRSLFKVDLDGNGTDEVVFAADSHGDDRPWTDEPYEAYSYVGVRQVRDDGTVATILLFEQRNTVVWDAGFPEIGRAWLAGFTDLDGDGRLEVVVGYRGYEVYQTFLHRVSSNGTPEMVGTAGCAI